MTDEFESVGKSLGEKFQHLRENSQVIDWWQQQLTRIRYAYDGVSFTVNKTIADLINTRTELLSKISSLEERNERLETDLESANASIGELQSDLVNAVKRLDKIAEWANKERGIEK